MGKFQVTQAQWRVVARYPQAKLALNPEPSYHVGDNRPVERVSWDEATEFCARLSRKTGHTYRLPSEAEWEYACRAKTNTPFHFGLTITPNLANYKGIIPYGSGIKGLYRNQTTPVGNFSANGFGLHDMHGNVREWCEDVWHENYQSALVDSSAWISGGDNHLRVIRGGSWCDDPKDCRSAFRFGDLAGHRDDDTGFRLVCVAPWTP
jgi:formylglycine-generating enzyme required for sulfatase activity